MLIANAVLADFLTTVLAQPIGEGRTLHFNNKQGLCNFRAKFYQLKRDARAKSRRGIDPLDPTYDTSPWDTISTRVTGHNMLWVGVETLNTLGVTKIT